MIWSTSDLPTFNFPFFHFRFSILPSFANRVPPLALAVAQATAGEVYPNLPGAEAGILQLSIRHSPLPGDIHHCPKQGLPYLDKLSIFPPFSAKGRTLSDGGCASRLDYA
jgi:hypothetical protein